MNSDKGQLRARFDKLSQRLDEYDKQPVHDHQRVQALIKEGDLDKIRGELEQCKQDVKEGKTFRNWDLILLDSFIKLKEGYYGEKASRSVKE